MIAVDGCLFFSHPFSQTGNMGRMDGWIKFSLDQGATCANNSVTHPHTHAL